MKNYCLKYAKHSGRNYKNKQKISFLYVCLVKTIYLFSFVEAPRKFIIATSLRGVSTKLNK